MGQRSPHLTSNAIVLLGFLPNSFQVLRLAQIVSSWATIQVWSLTQPWLIHWWALIRPQKSVNLAHCFLRHAHRLVCGVAVSNLTFRTKTEHFTWFYSRTQPWLIHWWALIRPWKSVNLAHCFLRHTHRLVCGVAVSNLTFRTKTEHFTRFYSRGKITYLPPQCCLTWTRAQRSITGPLASGLATHLGHSDG